jgi:hypothetical protein
VVVSQNKLSGLFSSPNSKCGTWKLEIAQLLKFEHPEFGFTSEQQHSFIISHGVPTSEFTCCLKKQRIKNSQLS